jgi:hypothetical protein
MDGPGGEDFCQLRRLIPIVDAVLVVCTSIAPILQCRVVEFAVRRTVDYET